MHVIHMNSMTQDGASVGPNTTPPTTAVLPTGTTAQSGTTNTSQTTAPNEDNGSVTEDEPINTSPTGKAGDWGFGLADARTIAQQQRQTVEDPSQQQGTNDSEQQQPPPGMEDLSAEVRDFIQAEIATRVREANLHAQQRVERVTMYAEKEMEKRQQQAQHELKLQHQQFQKMFDTERARREFVLDTFQQSTSTARTVTQPRPRPLYTFTPCEKIVYPGPSATKEEYRNYLTLIDGQLSQNPSVDDLMHGRIKHPIASDPTLMAKITNHYTTVLRDSAWTFNPRDTGLTIEVVRRNNEPLADEMQTVMRDHHDRGPGESYTRLNKALYMAIHRTTQAVTRDKELVSNSEHGMRAQVYDGLGLYKDIKTLSDNTKGLNSAEVKRNLIGALREPVYIPGTDGIRNMFATIKAARTDLGTMDPPTVLDDATVLLDVQRVLERAHASTFVAAYEQIENNRDLHSVPTNMCNAEAVYKRFEKRLVLMIRANPKSFGKLDLTNVHARQANVSAHYEDTNSGYNRGQGRGRGRGRGRGNKRPRTGGKGRGRGRGHGRGRDHGRDNKRTRNDDGPAKHCVHHPYSTTHDTEECTNPYSTNSLWGDQGNETLSNEDWTEMQTKGQGPPTRTHGQPPITELQNTPMQYPRTPRTTGYRPATPPTPYYGPGPATGRPPQQPYLPSHLAVNAAYGNNYQPQQQQQQQQWQQQQQQQQQQHHHQQQQQQQPPASGPGDTRMVKFKRTPQQQQPELNETRTTGYHPRTVPVAQINAKRSTTQTLSEVDIQPVDAMQAIMKVVKQYGGRATYPTTQEVSDFGRGGSFPRRF